MASRGFLLALALLLALFACAAQAAHDAEAFPTNAPVLRREAALALQDDDGDDDGESDSLGASADSDGDTDGDSQDDDGDGEAADDDRSMHAYSVHPLVVEESQDAGGDELLAPRSVLSAHFPVTPAAKPASLGDMHIHRFTTHPGRREYQGYQGYQGYMGYMGYMGTVCFTPGQCGTVVHNVTTVTTIVTTTYTVGNCTSSNCGAAAATTAAAPAAVTVVAAAAPASAVNATANGTAAVNGTAGNATATTVILQNGTLVTVPINKTTGVPIVGAQTGTNGSATVAPAGTTPNGTTPAGPANPQQGPQGTAGAAGNAGTRGPAGPTGPKGDTGATGTVTEATKQEISSLSRQVDAAKAGEQRVTALESAVFPSWFNKTDACPDGWFKVGFYHAEGRVHCRLPLDANGTAKPQNPNCLAPNNLPTVIMLPERYDRNAWCKYCRASWAAYGCCFDEKNEFVLNTTYCVDRAKALAAIKPNDTTPAQRQCGCPGAGFTANCTSHCEGTACTASCSVSSATATATVGGANGPTVAAGGVPPAVAGQSAGGAAPAVAVAGSAPAAGAAPVTVVPESGSPASNAYRNNALVNTSYATGGATQAVGGGVIPENSPNAIERAMRRYKLTAGNGFGVTATNASAQLSLEQLANKFEDEIEDASLGNPTPAVVFPVPGGAAVAPANLTDVQKARLLRDKILTGEVTLLSVDEESFPANAETPLAAADSEAEQNAAPSVVPPGPFVPPEMPREPVAPERFFRKLMF